MAEFEFNCPQCGQTIEADESLRGQVAECPHCGKGIVVPRGKAKSQMIHLSDMKTEEHTPVATGRSTNDQTAPKHSTSQGYVCTHCGENVLKPIKIRGKLLGCFYVLLGLLLGGSLTLASPIIGIALAVIFLVAGVVADAQGNRMKCPKCGKLETMISAASPQGRRLLKECGGHPDDNEEQAPNSIHESPEDRLLKLLKLKEMGIVSDGEYEEKRRKILAEI